MLDAARVRDWRARGFALGHAGTLDPFATGLLLVLSGSVAEVPRAVAEEIQAKFA